MTEFEIKLLTRQESIDKWNALPEDIRINAVNFLKSHYSETFFDGMRDAFNRNNDTWWAAGFHFGQGMSVRNDLRQSGITDDMLPSRNWDDYYIQAIEAAAGVL